MKRGKELKRDMETVLVGSNRGLNSGNTTTARVTASVLSWIKTNTDKGATGTDPSAADGTGTRGSFGDSVAVDAFGDLVITVRRG